MRDLVEVLSSEEEEEHAWLSKEWPSLQGSAGHQRRYKPLRRKAALATVARGVESLRDVVFVYDQGGDSVYHLTAFMTGLVDTAFSSLGQHYWSLAPHSSVPSTYSVAALAVTAFAKAIQDEDAVEAVYWRRDGDVSRVWSVLNEYDREVEDRIYQAEAEILDGYKDIQLAFRVLYRHGKDAAQVRPAQSQVAAS